MAYAVSITDDAARDLDELYAHHHLHGDPGKADLLLDRIQDVFRTLAEEPTAGSYPKELLAHGVKEYRAVSVYPCRIVYRIDPGAVHILLIADARRDMQDSLVRRLLEP
jgi:toxin ParE1/3/4